MGRRLTCATLLGAIALGCGGGGDGGVGGPSTGDDPWSSVSFTVSPPHPHLCQLRGFPRAVEATLTLDSAPAHGELWENTMLDGEVRLYGYLSDREIGESTYRFSAPTLQSDPVGVREGIATFEICSGLYCKDRLTRLSFPYTLEVVAPLPPLAVSVDGQVREGSGTWNDEYAIRSGQTITLTSSVPVTWDTGSKQGDPSIVELSRTPTSWTVTISGTPSEFVALQAFSSCQRVTSASAYIHFSTP